MEKIETLLYKVLIATEHPRNNDANDTDDTDGTCLPVEYFEKTKDCLKVGDRLCTFIDLLANKAECYECVPCEDTIMPCKRYKTMTRKLPLPEVTISNDGTISKIDMNSIRDSIKTNFDVPQCKCIPSQYKYTNILGKENFTSISQPLLWCDCENHTKSQQYCTLIDGNPSCYERNAKCNNDDGKVKCSISKIEENATNSYIIIDGLNGNTCPQLKEILQCGIEFGNASMDDIANNNTHLKWSNNIQIDVSCIKEAKKFCYKSINIMCEKNFNIDKCKLTENPATKPSEPSKPTIDTIQEPDSSGSNSFTILLIIVIIILGIVFLLYVGYQNHEKVNLIM